MQRHERTPEDTITRALMEGKLAIASFVEIGPLAGRPIITLTPRAAFEQAVRDILQQSEEEQDLFAAETKTLVLRRLQTTSLEERPGDQDLHDDLSALLAISLVKNQGQDFWKGTGLAGQSLEVDPDTTLPRKQRGLLSEAMEARLRPIDGEDPFKQPTPKLH